MVSEPDIERCASEDTKHQRRVDTGCVSENVDPQGEDIGRCGSGDARSRREEIVRSYID